MPPLDCFESSTAVRQETVYSNLVDLSVMWADEAPLVASQRSGSVSVSGTAASAPLLQDRGSLTDLRTAEGATLMLLVELSALHCCSRAGRFRPPAKADNHLDSSSLRLKLQLLDSQLELRLILELEWPERLQMRRQGDSRVGSVAKMMESGDGKASLPPNPRTPKARQVQR